MGDISAEPSMEEILSSIKRIIAEEGDAATGARSRRTARTVPRPDPIAPHLGEDEGILELSEPVAEEPSAVTPMQAATPAPMPIGAPDVPSQPEAMLSDRVVEATRGPLEALSRMVVKPELAASAAEASQSQTIDALVRELLKPMLSDWLDANLPQIVEAMVAKEISRITGR
jgi:cell pole-organizing protein PopZ